MAVDIFINMSNGIEGETTDKVRAANKDIDVLAWSWGMSQSGTTHMGGGGGSGKASFQDLSFTKYVDTASNALMFALAKGTHIDKAELIVRKSGEGQKPYITITMEEVIVTSVSTGGSGGEDRLTENVTLNFAKVKFAYKPQSEKGILGAEKPFTWNIAEADGNVS
ncbi:type VI secretion system tube protein Hcp [[Empedobacter] haloabium]|uniref:Type VI secretion system tube protein Hcp n=1 Tax=[Empedobacter] haloabium TaxID=592317 RepID=A0ABZ1UE59_9BURK